jgi:hypothetical protein
MGTPRTEDLTIIQGNDTSISLQIFGTDGEPDDINNKLFQGGLKSSYTSTESIVNFGVEVIDANVGSIAISLTSTQTAALKGDTRYVYDVVMYESGNTQVERVLDGKIFVRPSVTILGS